MTYVYIVWGWDSMASNWGEHYVDGVYAAKEKADERAGELNEQYRRARYVERARVQEVELK